MRAAAEQGLVHKLRRRDPEAFAGLWQSQQNRLWSAASAVLGEGATAEAALRETVELAWAECDRVRGDPGAWLVARCARVLLREAGRGAPQAKAAGDGSRGRLLAALAGLPAQERALLLLHHLGGLGAQELARASGWEPAEVRRAIHRGRVAVVGLMEETDFRGRERPRRGAGQEGSAQGGGTHASNDRRRGGSGAGIFPGPGEGPLRHR